MIDSKLTWQCRHLCAWRTDTSSKFTVLNSYLVGDSDFQESLRHHPHTCHEVHEWMSLLHNSLKILPLIWRVNFRWRLTHSCGHFLHFGLFIPKISISANHWYVTFLHVIDPHCIHTTLHVYTLTSISVGGGSDGDVGSEKAVSTVREHVCTHTCTEWRLYLET